jgi:putative ABC transport system ATP-binding protein
VLDLRDVVRVHVSSSGDTVRAVDGVSMSVQPGEVVALYGPSGSGKTTLLQLAAALLQPNAGSISFDGRDVAALTADAAAQYRMNDLGIVRQHVRLFPGLSAADNAALKLMAGTMTVREARRTVTPLLKSLGLAKRLDHQANELSMGEQQRVMIARALSTKPRLILADEPTGNLDLERGAQALELLTAACRERGTGMLLVTHDPQAARFADRVEALRDGQLVDFDPAAFVLG